MAHMLNLASRGFLRTATRMAPLRSAPCLRTSSMSLRAISSLTPTLAPHPSESFLSGSSAIYVEEMYRDWLVDPSSVHKSWNAYFTNVEAGLEPGAAFLAPPSIQPGVSPVASTGAGAERLIKAVHLIRAWQVRGHEVASLDPLNLAEKEELSELDYKSYGISEADLDVPMNFTGVADFAVGSAPLPAGVNASQGILGTSAKDITLRQLLEQLKNTYGQTIGWEYMHINSREQCNWLRERIELEHSHTKEQKLQMLDRMTYAENFEKFIGLKYGSYKRFGLDGCESLIPGMKTMIDVSTELGVKYITMGMPHRGRLNTLCNVVRKPAEEVFKGFDDVLTEMSNEGGDWAGSGDVKYHLGMNYTRAYEDGREVHLSLLPNPSHLEAVNPVTVGKVRAEQDRRNDSDGTEVMGVLMHGDAAFAGQGVVYETLEMSQLRKYTTHGTIHVVVNNQIGFTTNPRDSRSTKHCTDIGKAFDGPIFHVNADDVEAVCRVFKVAAEWRHKFRSDCIIDLVGYRRFGHNETDQPAFTQPRMYNAIKGHPTTLTLYTQQLIAEGTVTPEQAAEMADKVMKGLTAAFDARTSYEAPPRDLADKWAGFKNPNAQSAPKVTGVPEEELRAVGKVLTTVPEGFNVHPTLKRSLVAKEKSLESGEKLDWATAEALAFGTLVKEGTDVRISGQDVQRGTFSHRHAKWHDQKDFDKRYVPLANVSPDQARITLANSPLHEFGVLGFEFGYSIHKPDQLVIWEGQFGDFVNGAQVITDQFVSCSEVKWSLQSGLVMLLPHGHDGGGPEHSSSRLERFLQMSDDKADRVPEMVTDKRSQIQHTNWQVVNITTPANYFHALRRQVYRDFRKPLIVMSPKSLLRHPEAQSTLAEMSGETRFQRYIGDQSNADASKVKRILLCSGKIYYDLAAYRKANDRDDVVIGRVEQICPFPFDLVAAELAKYPDAEVRWVQEEPQNQGAWTYVAPRIVTAAEHFNNTEPEVSYSGRLPMAATSVGSTSRHAAEQAAVVADAFTFA